MAVIDVLATWADILAKLGYRQLGISVRVASIEPDTKKQGRRRNMLAHLSRLLDSHSVAVDNIVDVAAP